MDWGDLGRKLVEFGAPLLGGVLGGPAGAGVGRLVAAAIVGKPDATPDEVDQALIANPEAAIRLREIERDQRVELEKLAVQGEQYRLAHERDLFAQAGETQRAEIASSDPYVRRARPTLVYVACLAVGAVVLALCGSIGFATLALFMARGAEAVQIAALGDGVQILLAGAAQLAGALMPIIVSVVTAAGYYIKRRSDEKEVDVTGERNTGLLGALSARLRKGGV